MKKVIIWALLISISFLTGAIISYHLPKVEAWLITWIEKESREHTPLGMLPERLSLGFFPPQIRMEGIRIIPSKDLKDQLDPFILDSAALKLSWSAFIKGSVRAINLQLSGADIHLRLKADSGADQDFSLYHITQALEGLPLDSVRFSDVNVIAHKSNGDFLVSLSNLSLESFVSWGQLHIKSSIDALRFPLPQYGDLVETQLTLHAQILEDQLNIQSLTLGQKGFEFNASGPIFWSENGTPKVGYDIKSNLKLDAHEFYNYVTSQVPDAKLPEMRGSIEITSLLSGHGLREPTVSLEVSTERLHLDRYEIGRLIARGLFSRTSLTADWIKIQNSAGKVSLENAKIDLDESRAIQGDLKIESVQLGGLLKALGVNDAPVEVGLQGSIPCNGAMTQDFFVECRGEIALEDLVVEGGENPIVSTEKLSAKGNVRVTSTDVRYDADLTMGEKTRGKSSGTIHYEKGFDLSFETPELFFSDLSSIANLQLEGSAALRGRTWGTSKWGRVDASLRSPNFSLENYDLGTTNAKVSYRNGSLKFSDLEGRLRNTRYLGDINILLRESSIAGELQLSYLELQDLQHSFHRNLELPMQIQGTGSGEVKFWGPLDISLLSYDLKSQAFRGKIGPEYFDQLNVEIRSRDGVASFKNTHLTKGSSKIKTTGSFQPLRTVDLKVESDRLRVEDSTIVNRWSNDVLGLAAFKFSVTGLWKDNSVVMDGELLNMRVAGNSLGDSSFNLEFNSSYFKAQGLLMNKSLDYKILYPLKANLPFDLTMKAKAWDITKFFSSLRSELSGDQFESSTDFELTFSSPTGDPWRSSGSLVSPSLKIRRGDSELVNRRPIRLMANDGVVTVESFELIGEGASIRIADRAPKDSPIDVEIQGKIQLHFLSLFTPFLDDLQGLISSSVNIKAGPDEFEMLGSAYIERGFFKPRDFPHPIEDVRADILFNQRKILLNTVRGVLAQGRIFASGQVEIKGFLDFPTSIDIRVDNVQLDIPTNYSTRGSGQLRVTGNWFPFTLGGEYRVQSGRITDNFTTGGGATSRRSKFLPQNLIEQQISPFQLNLAIRTESPLRIQNDLIDGRVQSEMRIQGTPESPVLRGTANLLPQSILLFRDNEFQVETAQIQFDGGSEINPALYITARTRVSGYDIQMLIQGSANRPELSLSSQPGLPEQDIISLLALGLTSTGVGEETDSEGVSGAGGVSSPLALGMALTTSELGREFKSQYDVDIQVSPIFDEETNTATTRWLLSRQVTPKLGAIATYDTGPKPKTDVRIKYQMNPQIFLVGSYVNRPFTESIDVQENQNSNIFGIDLEYRVDFR